MAPVRTGLRRVPLLGAVIGSEPVQHVVWTVRAARAVRETSRFTLAELLSSRTASYELRSSGLTVALRHRTRDVDIFKEIFGTGYAHNSYDPPPQVQALLDAAADPAVLDLGGNIGLFGAYVLGRWPRARVTSFEPDPTNLPLIRRTIAANDLEDRWRLQAVAVSNAAGALPFVSGLFAESQLAGLERAPERPEGSAALESGHTVTVPVVDLFTQDHRVELMKMDIEGGEWPILTDPRLPELGARAVVLEWHADGAPEPDARAAALRLLAAAGYVEVHETEDSRPSRRLLGLAAPGLDRPGQRPDGDRQLGLVAQALAGEPRHPAVEVGDHDLAVAPAAYPNRLQPLRSQQDRQAVGREAPVVPRPVVQAHQERRRDVHVTALAAEAPQRAHGGQGIGNVLEHLLADHEVEGARELLGRPAQIELGEVELRVAGPRPARPQVSAHLGDVQRRRIELLEGGARVRDHHRTQPLALGGVRLALDQRRPNAGGQQRAQPGRQPDRQAPTQMAAYAPAQRSSALRLGHGQQCRDAGSGRAGPERDCG